MRYFKWGYNSNRSKCWVAKCTVAWIVDGICHSCLTQIQTKSQYGMMFFRVRLCKYHCNFEHYHPLCIDCQKIVSIVPEIDFEYIIHKFK